MGQTITVTVRPGALPGVVSFELNRSLTGMETLRYAAGVAVGGNRPPDELARRLFAIGAEAVTIYSSVVTVAAPPYAWRELRGAVEDVIAKLFIHYRDGVVPPATGEAPPPGDAPVELAPGAAKP